MNAPASVVARLQVPKADGSDGFEITFGEPAGLERVFAFATEAPWPEWEALCQGGASGAALTGGLTRAMCTKATASAAARQRMAATTLTFELHPKRA